MKGEIENVVCLLPTIEQATFELCDFYDLVDAISLSQIIHFSSLLFIKFLTIALCPINCKNQNDIPALNYKDDYLAFSGFTKNEISILEMNWPYRNDLIAMAFSSHTRKGYAISQICYNLFQWICDTQNSYDALY